MTDTISLKDQQIKELENNIRTMEKTYDIVLKVQSTSLASLVTVSLHKVLLLFAGMPRSLGKHDQCITG